MKIRDNNRNEYTIVSSHLRRTRRGSNYEPLVLFCGSMLLVFVAWWVFSNYGLFIVITIGAIIILCLLVNYKKIRRRIIEYRVRHKEQEYADNIREQNCRRRLSELNHMRR